LCIPVLYTVHAHTDRGLQRSDFLIRWVAQACDRVVAVSHHTAAGVETFTGGLVQPQVILNGIDLKRLELGRGFRPQSKRKALGINEDELVLITVAALNKHKDHRTLFHAFAEVLPSFGDARLLVVGDGRDRAELQELVSRLGIRNRVMFLGCRSDVPELLAAADIFVLSTHTEGFPISVIEACCIGIPVVATEVGGLADLRRVDLGVLLIERENVGSLRDALLSLLDPQRRQVMRRQLHQQAPLLFDIGRTAGEYREVYEALM
jgi:glycosyltransferase involved in cell wall biosynthesis